MSVNLKRLVTSGLVSGLIINISAIAMVPMVGNEFDRVLADRGLPPLSPIAMVYFCGISFIFGFTLVWLYAILRTQFGTRVNAAIVIAIGFWFLTYFISNVSLVVYGFMPVKLTIIGTLWGLVELLLASIVGSRLYKGD